jgi:serine protease Do
MTVIPRAARQTLRLAWMAAPVALLTATLPRWTPTVQAKDTQTVDAIAVPAVAGAHQLPSLAPLISAVEPAVVAIEVVSEGPSVDLRGLPEAFREWMPNEVEPQRGEGSGFVISPSGEVLTNHHVVDGATEIVARFADGRAVPLTVVGVDPPTDIALLRLESAPAPWPYVALGASSAAAVGDWVVAVGNPLGLGLTATQGILSGKGRVLGHDAFDDFLQTDAAINQGNSGGPLFDLAGRVVGMNTAIIQGANTVGFAVPSDLIVDVVDRIRADGRVARGYLGVRLQPMDPTLAQALGVDHGALVADVEDDTPAARGGLASGDIILQVDGQDVADSQDVIRTIARRAPGERVRVQIRRDDAARELEVALGERPSPAEAQAERAAPPEAPARGKLGLSLAPLPPAMAQRLSIEQGVVVQGVADGSPADGTLRPGDVLLAVGGAPVTDAESVRREVARARGAVVLKILRNGVTQFVAIEVP